jgi:hypothetical protein
MAHKLKVIWKEAVVLWYEVLYRDIPGWTKESCVRCQDSGFDGVSNLPYAN